MNDVERDMECNCNDPMLPSGAHFEGCQESIILRSRIAELELKNACKGLQSDLDEIARLQQQLATAQQELARYKRWCNETPSATMWKDLDTLQATAQARIEEVLTNRDQIATMLNDCTLENATLQATLRACEERLERSEQTCTRLREELEKATNIISRLLPLGTVTEQDVTWAKAELAKLEAAFAPDSEKEEGHEKT